MHITWSAPQQQESSACVQLTVHKIDVLIVSHDMQACSSHAMAKKVGNAVWFDIVLSLPVGLALQDARDGKCVFVEDVREGGSAYEHNKKHVLPKGNARRLNWIQPGDKLIAVNGAMCRSTEAAVESISSAEDTENVSFKFARPFDSNITVVFPEDGTQSIVPFDSPVANAAEVAGHEVVYKCADGNCGSCWRKDVRSDEIYTLCIGDITVGKVPSKTYYKEDNIFWSEREYRNRKNNKPFFDNTEPLVLQSCPEDYQEWRKLNPVLATQSDLTVSRFGGSLSGLAGEGEVPESRSSKWGGANNWNKM